MNRIVLFLLICSAMAFSCDDSRLSKATIGGTVLQGSVYRKAGHPLSNRKVQLYRDKNLIRRVTTDEQGLFIMNGISAGNYKLWVKGWGSVTIEIDPKLDKLPNGQGFSYTLQLLDHECVGVTSISN